jgi:hypothetical protein
MGHMMIKYVSRQLLMHPHGTAARLAVKKWLLYMACFWFTNHKKMFLTAEKHVHFGIIVEPAVMKGAYMSVSKNSIDSTI